MNRLFRLAILTWNRISEVNWKSPKVSIQQHALNQRSPAEGKGKGQKLLAQGNAWV